MDGLMQVARLVFTIEEHYWVAYMARPDSMDDAVRIGTILMASIAEKPESRATFIQLMTDSITEIIGGSLTVGPVENTEDKSHWPPTHPTVQ